MLVFILQFDCEIYFTSSNTPEGSFHSAKGGGNAIVTISRFYIYITKKK